MEPRVLAEPVLVGRERELEELKRFFASAKEDKGKTVFVSAEAGIGKTRLIREFLSSVKQKKNIVTLSGWCLFNAGVPYFPFIEAFSSYYSAQGEKNSKEEVEINSWLKEPAKTRLPGKLAYLSPQALKDQTFAAVAKTIHSIATRNPVILLIEDIHWADSASLALLHYVARAVNNSERVLVLATFRSEELTSDTEGYPHQLLETLAMMRREDLFKEIDLPSLNPTCVTEMAESMLGGSLQQSLAEKLAVESEGNPLFVVESMRMLHERNNLVKENNEWCLMVGELGIPSKIKDIILRRLARLNYAQRRVLDAASVIGEEFNVGLLSAVVEQDSLEVLETLNVIAHTTSIVRADESRYRFDHARSRETVYEELSSPLKRGYHERIAETLEKTKGGKLPLGELAYHYAGAGNKEKAVKFALTAGKDELARWINVQAIKHFEYVVQNIREDQAEEKKSALEGLGDAFYANNMYKEAMETFELLGDVSTDVVKLRAFRKAMDSAFQQGNRLRLIELLNKAEQYAAADRLENARVFMSKGRAFLLQTNILAAMENYKAALQVFEEEYSLWDVAFALIGLGGCEAICGMPKEGIAKCLRSIALFEELEDFRWQLEAYYVAGYTFGHCLLEHEALLKLAKVLEINEKRKMGDHLLDVFANAFSSRQHEQTGNLEEMLARSLKALELTQKTDSTTANGMVYSNLTTQYARLGDVKHAEEYFEKLMRLPPEILIHPYIDGALARAVFCASQGQWKESNKQFNEHLEKFSQTLGGYMVRVKLYYAWALEKQGLFEEARVQLDDIQKKRQEAKERFEHASVQANLMVRMQVGVGKEFEMRLDLVNVAEKAGTLVKVEGLIPLGCKITSMPSNCRNQNSSIVMNQKRMGPFQVETIKLHAVFENDGVYKLEPIVFYVDDLNEAKKTRVELITVTAQPSYSKDKLEGFVETAHGKFGFESEAVEKAFSFLVTAFEEDHLSLRLPQESSGWRTLMEVSRNGHVSKHYMYGRSGKGGGIIKELTHRGLIESRFFLGERGRGGRILKVRICIEKENVKQLLDRRRHGK